MRLDPDTQRLETLCGTEAFAGVRQMVPFKLTGQGKGESSGVLRERGQYDLRPKCWLFSQ